MEELIHSLCFLCGTLGACALILTGFFVIRGLIRFFEDTEKDKEIIALKKEIKNLQNQIETKTEIDRLRYWHDKVCKKK